MPFGRIIHRSPQAALLPPLGHAESLLTEHAYQHHQGETGQKTFGGLFAALKGSKSDGGMSLVELPQSILDGVAVHLDVQDLATLNRLWSSRLSPPAKRAMLNHLSRAYGFAHVPKASGWQDHLEQLAVAGSRHKIVRFLTGSCHADIALAGLLLGALKPYDAIARFSNHLGVVMRAVEQDGRVLGGASAALQDDREVVMRAVGQDGWALRYASAGLHDDREVVMRAVKRNGVALGCASAALQDDREVVMCAVEQNGWALRCANAALRDDREVVMRAVKQNGEALECASAALRDDREVVMCAVGKNGRALGWASAALQANREVVMRAVEQNGRALEYASATLKDDWEVVICAGKQTVVALSYASIALRDNPVLHRLVGYPRSIRVP